MSAIANRPILELLRSLKDDPLIQFLVGYCILEKEWRLEDISELFIRPTGDEDIIWQNAERVSVGIGFGKLKQVRLDIVRTGNAFSVEKFWDVNWNENA
jgi:hypothetical protein